MNNHKSVKKQKIVAIIPARGGSKGLKNKNTRIINGKPLISYVIEAAKNCDLINRVIVSTDDNKIASIAKKYGAEVPFLRPKELAQDLTPTEPVLKHAIEWLEKNEGFIADILVFLTPTEIVRTKHIIGDVIQKLLDNPKLDSVFVVKIFGEIKMENLFGLRQI
jgi:CMP-N,N'-diacetyllegionaminic acid synthase